MRSRGQRRSAALLALLFAAATLCPLAAAWARESVAAAETHCGHAAPAPAEEPDPAAEWCEQHCRSLGQAVPSAPPSDPAPLLALAAPHAAAPAAPSAAAPACGSPARTPPRPPPYLLHRSLRL